MNSTTLVCDPKFQISLVIIILLLTSMFFAMIPAIKVFEFITAITIVLIASEGIKQAITAYKTPQKRASKKKKDE